MSDIKSTKLSFLNPPFPIDLVYTWVDGTDIKHQQKRQQRIKEFQRANQYNRRSTFVYTPTRYLSKKHSLTTSIAPSAIKGCRWRNNNELEQSIQSILIFAPWVNQIYIITDDQQPRWYNELDDVSKSMIKLIDHNVIFNCNHVDLKTNAKQCLPTFNSHAIEANICFVPGLSEHFIYANDDCLVGKPVQYTDFFTPDGKARIACTRQLAPKTRNIPPYNPVMASRIHTCALLDKIFGHNPGRHNIVHQMKPLIKSSCIAAWENEHALPWMRATSFHPVRTIYDIAPIEFFIYFSIQTGKSLYTQNIQTTYIGITDFTTPQTMYKFLHRLDLRPVHLYCINDDRSTQGLKITTDVWLKFYSQLPHNKY